MLVKVGPPPEMSNGWLRALAALGSDLTPDEWVQKIGGSVSRVDVEYALAWLGFGEEGDESCG